VNAERTDEFPAHLGVDFGDLDVGEIQSRLLSLISVYEFDLLSIRG
jgi:hypothetical protein